MAEDVSPTSQGLPNTRWSKVEAAGQPASPEGLVAMDVLLTLYRPSLLAFLRNRFMLTAEDAEDLLHNFVHHKVLESNLFAAADRTQGRFRSYLFAVLRNYATSEIRRLNARKRSPDQDALPLDQLPEDQQPTAHDPNAMDRADHFWTRAIIAGAMLDMRHKCTQAKCTDTWQLFLDRLLRPLLAEEEPLPYGECVRRHQLDSPADAFNLLGTAKRMFRRHLRAVSDDFARDHREVGDNLHYLRRFMDELSRRT